MTKPLITLSCIVGNEEAVIERFIRSFEPAVDFAVFVQAIGTQPADKTMDIIGKVCEELDLPFVRQIYWNKEKWPHIDNFAAARQLAWSEAEKTKADYLLWADCDDLLKDGAAEALRAAAQAGDKDVFMCPYHVRGDKQISWRERMVKNAGFSRWVKPVHEILTFSRDIEIRTLHGAVIVHSPSLSRETSAKRNFTILEAQVLEGGSNLFFLAQEAARLGDRDTYLKCAKGALAHPCTETLDKYELHLMLAQSEPVCEVAKQHATRAYDLMPDRREALALLVCYALIDGRNEQAYQMAKHLISIPKPKLAYYSLNHEWYDWKGFYLFTQTLRAIGHSDKALKMEAEQFKKHGATFSICHATYKRPAQAAAIRDMYLSTARNPMAVEYIFGIHHDDAESLALLGNYHHTVTDKEGCCPNALEPMRASTGKFVMIIADDLFPPDGWDEMILSALHDRGNEIEIWPNVKIVLAFNDSLRPDWRTHLCHGFMTRPWLETVLADPWPGTGIFSDNEFSWRARKADVIIECPEIIFDHRHYTKGASLMDATYQDQNQLKNYKEGEKLFRERNPDYIAPPKPPSLEERLDQVKARRDCLPIRFIQIGAHDGKSLDPIAERVQAQQWEGVFVEPQPALFKALFSNHPARQGLYFENCAIAERDGSVKFYSFKDDGKLPFHATMLAGFSKNALLYNGHGYKGEIEETFVPCMTLESLLKKYSIEALEVLQIDTEGYDFEILKMLEKTSIRPMLIHYEHGILSPKDRADCETMLKNMGYTITVLQIDTLAYLEEK